MGTLVIISSPSGGGKDAVINETLKLFPGSARLTTTTSRPPRPDDERLKKYHFTTKENFEKMLAENKMLEHNIFAGYYYGIEKAELEKSLREHPLIFTNIDVNGKRSVDKAGIKNIAIFLLPENESILRARIQNRGGLTAQQIEERMETARAEMREADNYNFKIINKQGELPQTVAEVKEAIEGRLDGRARS